MREVLRTQDQGKHEDDERQKQGNIGVYLCRDNRDFQSTNFVLNIGNFLAGSGRRCL